MFLSSSRDATGLFVDDTPTTIEAKVEKRKMKIVVPVLLATESSWTECRESWTAWLYSCCCSVSDKNKIFFAEKTRNQTNSSFFTPSVNETKYTMSGDRSKFDSSHMHGQNLLSKHKNDGPKTVCTVCARF